jgi:hypothetical protein
MAVLNMKSGRLPEERSVPQMGNTDTRLGHDAGAALPSHVGYTVVQS